MFNLLSEFPLSPSTEGSNLGLFSRDYLRFEPLMGRLVVLSDDLGTASMLDFYK